MPYKFAGIIGIFIFFLIWLILYLHKKSLRKEMLIMGILTLPFGPISEILYLKDYWHPQYLINIFGFGIEDLLFAFLIGGIGAVIYEEFFIKRIRKGKREHSKFVALLLMDYLFLGFVLEPQKFPAGLAPYISIGIMYILLLLIFVRTLKLSRARTTTSIFNQKTPASPWKKFLLFISIFAVLTTVLELVTAPFLIGVALVTTFAGIGAGLVLLGATLWNLRRKAA